MAALLHWTSAFDLGHARMDATHHEFVAAVNALGEAADPDVLAAVDALIAHCEPHFDQENRWCDEVGMPPCHKGEHARVLELMHAVRAEVAKGEVAYGRRLAEALPEWFEQHATGMDAALAAMLNSGLTMQQVQAAMNAQAAASDPTAPSAAPAAVPDAAVPDAAAPDAAAPGASSRIPVTSSPATTPAGVRAP